MTRFNYFIGMVSLSILMVSACKKEDNPPVRKTIDVVISPGETYLYYIPGKGGTNDITTHPMFDSICALRPTGEGKVGVLYIPNHKFSGKDQMVVTVKGADSGNNKHHHCGDKGSQEDIYTFNFTMKKIE